MNSVKEITLEQLLSDKLTVGEMRGIMGCEIHAKNGVLTITTPNKTITIKDTDKGGAKAPRASAAPKAAGARSGTGRRGRRPSHTFEELAPRVKEMRDQGMTQREVAEALDTTQANVSKIERQLKQMEAEGQTIVPNNVVPTEVPIETPAETQA